MDMVAIVGVAIVGLVLAVVLRQYRPEYAVIVSLITGIVILAVVLRDMMPVVENIQALFTATEMPSEYIEILLKALGICFITQLACDTCKDAGEGSIASKVEMAGKLAVLLLTLPLFGQVLDIALGLIKG